MKARHPNPDLQLVSSDRLIGELVRRCDHLVIAYYRDGVSATKEGMDITVHTGGKVCEGPGNGNVATLALLHNAAGLILRNMAEGADGK